MEAFWASTIFVVLAEMGDKTQLLGMAFATRYKAATVLAGVFVATLLNHLLAVALGDYLTAFVPMETIQLAAAISFIFFGLWTVRGDELEGEDKKEYFGPFLTVTIAFFIAEMGDKTQLASVALAAKYHNLIPVWMGTTTGMMISNVIGILVGVVLGKKIPERIVKYASAAIFIFFGYAGIIATVHDPAMRYAVVAGITVITGIALYMLTRGGKEPARSE
ncbi:TMEM165/GDT1 family protein [Heliobacterium undosum]|uniref:GDT1 family protein n=1 Tax=Heliomicrobium undosum TaxID=121734 RepID=A0A845L3A7_9FIRM|nr:TMEM165/GDT1 family protein [Heliomicrobium undosum]MZP31107.1 TMEM165/GDT1 family protein [Heliomicrobium undosum]